MKKAIQIILTVLLAVSCSEPFDLKTTTSDRRYLCVEGILTSLPVTQSIRLTESIDYQSDGTVPMVSGAKVEVSDGEKSYLFSENPDNPGNYTSPRGFVCRKGGRYSLKIECTLSNGKARTCEAVTEMEQDGFDIEKIDVMNMGPGADSTWVIGVWGTDRPQTSYFLISTAVNGVTSPTNALLERAMIMPDTYFNGAHVNGFPIGYLYQNAMQQQKYGDCAKPLKKGDLVSLVVYTMSKDYYDFVMALSSASSAISIPIIASQPANIPTNLAGEDVMGYFAACPVTIASCIVDDPARTEFKY